MIRATPAATAAAPVITPNAVAQTYPWVARPSNLGACRIGRTGI